MRLWRNPNWLENEKNERTEYGWEENPNTLAVL